MEIDKFDTCQFRSADKEEHFIRICCGRTEKQEGFSCTLLSIFGIHKDICSECLHYKPINESNYGQTEE